VPEESNRDHSWRGYRDNEPIVQVEEKGYPKEKD